MSRTDSKKKAAPPALRKAGKPATVAASTPPGRKTRPSVKDDARGVAQAFAGAVDATIEEARSRLKKGD